MTSAYTAGLLRFDYPQPFSKLREDYLVTFLENRSVAEVLKTEALLAAHLLPLSTKTKNIGKEVFELFKSYAEIILPSSKKPAKLKEITKEDRIAIRDHLRSLSKDMFKRKPSAS